MLHLWRKRSIVDDPAIPLTESVNPSTKDLDRLGTRDLLQRINDEDRRAAWAVEREIDVIATAVDEIVKRVRDGGRLHYFGAGTSGRIAVVDAAEIPPTFGDAKTVVAHIAGGGAALLRSQEGAEDDAAAGKREVEESGISAKDAVAGISASGGAAYVVGALEAARSRKALTIGVTNNPQSQLARAVDVPIVLRTGAEVIAGSTRMKAGSAQKMALTMISTAVMVKLGKVYGNLMIDLQPSNEKLRRRAHRLTQAITGASPAAVAAALRECGYRPKIAIIMLHDGCDAAEAERLLSVARDDLRAVLTGESK